MSNGLALCRLHHGAYDRMLLGVRPELVVEVRDDILEAEDGPMLEHGLKRTHGQRLTTVPHRPADRPDPEGLAQRYAEFKRSA